MNETSQSFKLSEQALLNSSSPLLDEIIEKLVNHDKYEKFTIDEDIRRSSQPNLPYLIKEKEIRLLIASAEEVFLK